VDGIDVRKLLNVEYSDKCLHICCMKVVLGSAAAREARLKIGQRILEVIEVLPASPHSRNPVTSCFQTPS